LNDTNRVKNCPIFIQILGQIIHTFKLPISKNVSNNVYRVLGGFGDFYTMKRAAPAVSEIDEWTLAKLLEALQDRKFYN